MTAPSVYSGIIVDPEFHDLIPPLSDIERIQLIAYKGFDTNLQCRGFQFAVGESYTHEGRVAACESGFHACENPLDVFAYYAPGDSRFCTVEVTGELSRHADDSKVAAAKIKIVAEYSIPQIVTAAVA